MPVVSNKEEMVTRSLETLKAPAVRTYLERFPKALAFAKQQSGIDYHNPEEDAEKLGKFFQYFWEALPDSKDIRGYPFGDICDLAEWYCFGDR